MAENASVEMSAHGFEPRIGRRKDVLACCALAAEKSFQLRHIGRVKFAFERGFPALLKLDPVHAGQGGLHAGLQLFAAQKMRDIAHQPGGLVNQ